MLPPSERLPNYLDSLGGYKNINNINNINNYNNINNNINNNRVQHDDSKSIDSIS